MTELRAAENRVQRTEERLRDAIASSREFAVLSTDLHGVITTWNDGAAIMFGYRADEIKGQSIDVLFTPEDRADPSRENGPGAGCMRSAASNDNSMLRFHKWRAGRSKLHRAKASQLLYVRCCQRRRKTITHHLTLIST
ncbi:MULTISPECIES: PAS domain-containing protein [unclassified Caballeronia]|uniref:PAS domain-containing protein n=1 Tax=unclassified Caballeronia TaxID=2646786 RepID=UPI00285796DF|nr:MULTISPECIES: PAS domain-containing protein [unclassified Caballeronia]MDR5777439.1 PAS domain-containing protein [Caballeronia sp. LZ002]MDR5852877.1 PAS domain-containing protein [Caballeronia sp. LZ003]